VRAPKAVRPPGLPGCPCARSILVTRQSFYPTVKTSTVPYIQSYTETLYSTVRAPGSTANSASSRNERRAAEEGRAQTRQSPPGGTVHGPFQGAAAARAWAGWRSNEGPASGVAAPEEPPSRASSSSSSAHRARAAKEQKDRSRPYASASRGLS
jgi:hypothetical protein